MSEKFIFFILALITICAGAFYLLQSRKILKQIERDFGSMLRATEAFNLHNKYIFETFVAMVCFAVAIIFVLAGLHR